MRIPFDSLTLAAVTHELQQFVGGKVQRITQPNDFDLVLGIYAGSGEAYLLLSCNPIFSRAHLITKRPGNQAQPPTFCATLRARIEGARVTTMAQVDFDRILVIEFELADGKHRLVAELMGKHSNLILIDEGNRSVTAAKWVGKTKSVRPILPGMRYDPPPFEPKKPIYEALAGEDLKDTSGASPFLVKLLAASGPQSLATLKRTVLAHDFHPVFSPENGGYPISVAPLGLPELPRASISIALEQHFDLAIPQHELDTLRTSLVGQLERVLLARDVALSDLNEAKDTAARAGQMQLMGELILAYGPTIAEGARLFETLDYEGKPLSIKLDPAKSYLENANAYFEKAKRAKSRQGLVVDQIERISADRDELVALLDQVRATERLADLRDLQDLARKKRWLHSQPAPTKTKEERPYQGHRIRELQGPNGYLILYGENAESNDYLTLRVAKPNDWWIHVRGGISAHVVIVTRNQPEKVSREVLLYAAKIAVQNSPSKHSGYVPVDYTLRKYVRKPKGAPKGTALYTHEKTLHVD